MQPFLHKSTLRALGLSEDTWGFIIFRTAYGEGYDEKFIQALNIVDDQVRREAYIPPIDALCCEASVADLKEIGDMVMEEYQNIIFDDQVSFEDASIKCLCHHYLAWLHGLGPVDEFDLSLTRSETLIFMFDAETIDSIIRCSYSRDRPPFEVLSLKVAVPSELEAVEGYYNFSTNSLGSAYLDYCGSMANELHPRASAIAEWYYIDDQIYESKSRYD